MHIINPYDDGWMTMGALKINVYNNVWAEVEANRVYTAAVISDIHPPFEDPVAIELCFNILKSVSPDICIFNGDVIDFFQISKFTKDPNLIITIAQERKISVVTPEGKPKGAIALEIDMAKPILNRFTSQIKAQWIFISGNHEERYREFLWRKAPELGGIPALDLCAQLGLTSQRIIHLVRQDRPVADTQFVAPLVKLGKLYVLHGDTIRIGSNTINIARSLFLRMGVNMLISHWHRFDQYVQTTFAGEALGCWVNGCLSLQRPHWDFGKIWGQGITLITVTPNGFFKVDPIYFLQQDGAKIAFVAGQKYAVKIKEGDRYA